MTYVFRKAKSRRQHALFLSCQIEAVNKQLISLLSWSNLLLETTLYESYVLTIYRHLDTTEKDSLEDAEGIYNM